MQRCAAMGDGEKTDRAGGGADLPMTVQVVEAEGDQGPGDEQDHPQRRGEPPAAGQLRAAQARGAKRGDAQSLDGHGRLSRNVGEMRVA